MGRFLTPLPQVVAKETPVWELQEYAARPVFEFVSMNVSSPNAYRSVFTANDPFNYIEALGTGSVSGTRSRSFARSSDEAINSGYYICGVSSGPGNTSGWSPTSACWGITGFHDTGTCNHWFSNEAGDFGYNRGDMTAEIYTNSATVVPVAKKNHNYDMVVFGGFLKIAPVGGTWAAFFGEMSTALTYTKDRALNLRELPGFQNPSNLYEATNRGMASYNANSGKFVMVEGAVANNNNFIIHQWNIGVDVLHKDITYKELLSLFTAATYSYYTIALPSMSYTKNNAGSGDHRQHRIIACDDGSLWFVANDKTNNGLLYLRNYAIPVLTGADGTALTPVLVNTVTSDGTHYGMNQGTTYSTKFMLSDDNKYLAVYSHYYYYYPGAIGHIVTTNTSQNRVAANNVSSFSYTNSSYGISIAPIGGSKFVFGYASNADGANFYPTFVDPSDSGATYSRTHTSSNSVNAGGQYLMYSTSTNYNSCFFNKVTPLSTYK